MAITARAERDGIRTYLVLQGVGATELHFRLHLARFYR